MTRILALALAASAISGGAWAQSVTETIIRQLRDAGVTELELRRSPGLILASGYLDSELVQYGFDRRPPRPEAGEGGEEAVRDERGARAGPGGPGGRGGPGDRPGSRGGRSC